MKKIIILTFDKSKDSYYLRKLNEVNGIYAFPILLECNFFKKALRKILLFKCKLPLFIGLWTDQRTLEEHLSDCDLIICMANSISSLVLKYLNKKYKLKCINYFWDKIEISKYPVINSNFYQNWTFDEKDSILYKIRYNPQFYVPNVVPKAKRKKYDIFFCGADRDGEWGERVKIINSIYEELQNQNLKLKFCMVTKSKNCLEEIKYFAPIKQDEYYKMFSCSRAVLEIVEPGSEWITLRVFEALTNEIKLITNNRNIKNYDFYDAKNIFILGIDKDITSFINTPFNNTFQFSKYSVSAWKDRFFDET